LPDRQVAKLPAPDHDTDLSRLTPTDLALVRRWVEDKLINAVTPLDIRLQLEQPGVLACPVGEGPHSHGACDLTCQEARRTVTRILEIVDEVRALSGDLWPGKSP